MNQLIELGFGATIVPGPLIRATTGGRYPKPTHMPLAVSSAFAPTKALLTQAYVLANVDKMDPDPDLDVEPGRAPRWTTHSLRRGADTAARRHMGESGATEGEIDIYFGWHEKILLKSVQLHYAAMQVRVRMLLATITGYM